MPTLYHFTSPKHIRGCLRDGLTKGHVPARLQPPKLISGWQWLTSDPSFEQSWNSMENLDYDRTAYRIAINITRLHQRKLHPWLDVCDKLVCDRAKRSLNGRGDPENWVLFKGVVRPQWFTDVTAKEGYTTISLSGHQVV